MDQEPFLGVAKSALGRRWVERAHSATTALAISQRLNAPEIIGRILSARNVEVARAERYLAPTLKDDLPDPSVVTDMDKAAIRVAEAVIKREPIAIFGDYDVDGATSSALLGRFFRALGLEPQIYIPDRQREGYGPNVAAMTQLAQGGAKIIITVDCGTQAHEAIEAATSNGADVIVCDHHIPAATLPNAFAIVNPNRSDDVSDLGQLAAVGVAFMLCVAINRELRKQGQFKNSDLPDLRLWLGIVALGTVADVVPLTGVNRAFVNKGLEAAATDHVPGIAALKEVGRVSGTLDAYHLGFVLGPRVNAGGRVGRCDLGSRLLYTEDPAEARTIARELEDLNQERRAIEQHNLEEAIALVEHAPEIRDAPVIVVSREHWHPGVIGIVASRLKDRFGKPAIVIAINDGIGKGSGRSIAGVDLGAAIVAAREEGMLINGGGHKMAAGLTIEPAKVPALSKFLSHRLLADCSSSPEGRELSVDGALSIQGASIELYDVIARCGPFGSGNPEPVFIWPSVKVAFASIVGEQHVRCTLTTAQGHRLQAIAFRAVQSELGPMLLSSKGRDLHVAGQLKADTYQGSRRIQVQIRDAAFA